MQEHGGRLRLLDPDGIALVLVLVVMAAVSILTVALATNNTVEIRIVGNQRAAEIAFRNAESGINVARKRLAQWFAVDPINQARLRSGSGTPPDWDFLFVGQSVYTENHHRNDQYDEVRIDLGADDVYMVFARLANDMNDDNFTTTGSRETLILRSVGFGPGGAEQEIEMMLEVAAEANTFTPYAQEGGGAMKTYVNVKERHAISWASGIMNNHTMH